jgi:hypothetical protein
MVPRMMVPRMMVLRDKIIKTASHKIQRSRAPQLRLNPVLTCGVLLDDSPESPIISKKLKAREL